MSRSEASGERRKKKEQYMQRRKEKHKETDRERPDGKREGRHGL